MLLDNGNEKQEGQIGRVYFNIQKLPRWKNWMEIKGKINKQIYNISKILVKGRNCIRQGLEK